MIGYTIDSDLEKAIGGLSMLDDKNMRFAIAKALTQTAKEVQAEVKKNMPQRFMLRRQWIVNGIRINPATKETLVATIYSKDVFMARQEYGTDKVPMYGKHLAIPTSAVRTTKTGIIAKADLPSALGNDAAVINYKGHQWLALRSGARHKRLRASGKLRLMYLLMPRAHIQKRLGLSEDGLKIAKANFLKNLQAAIAYAIKTAR